MFEFLELVGRIYDASLSQEIWNDVLDDIRIYVGAEAAALSAYEISDQYNWNWQYHAGYDPKYLKVYEEKYLAMNPYMSMVSTLGAGEIEYASNQANYPELLHSEFYLGWMKPQGFLDGAVLVIDKSVTAIATLVTVRTEAQGFFGQPSVAALDLLYPHLRRAAAIGRMVGEGKARARTLASALDALEAGVFLLSPSAQIVHTNRTADEMLAAKTPVRAVRGRLDFVAGAGGGPLRSVLQGTLDPSSLEASAASTSIEGSDGQEYIVHAMALDPSRREAISAERQASFIVFVKEASPMTAAAVAAVAQRHGLTAQEARVLRIVVDAGGVPLAADALNLSPTTVRTHVARIFDKTGIRSQGGLIRLLSETGSPFRAAT